jgi:hypothetical protein
MGASVAIDTTRAMNAQGEGVSTLHNPEVIITAAGHATL